MFIDILLLTMFFFIDLLSAHIYSKLHKKTGSKLYLFMKVVAMTLAASKAGMLLGMALK